MSNAKYIYFVYDLKSQLPMSKVKKNVKYLLI